MDSIAQYDQLRKNNKFTFAIFFRGHWCPFCMGYLRQAQSLTAEITQAGGQIFAITAEAADQIQATRAASGFEGEIISDPENKLAAELKRRGVLDVIISDKPNYPHGMAQPAILVGTHDKVLYSWRIVPSLANLGGAKDRPDLQQVWASSKSQLNGGEKKYVNPKGFGFLNMMSRKLFG